MNEPHLIQALLPNPHGHDYLVGDIHAHFSRLQTALDARGFRPDRDRLIAVGDLIDRGPENMAALEWLEKPWFHSIRGNHEDLYLGWRSLHGQPMEQRQYELDGYRKNGGTWMGDVSDADHARLETAIEQLPYMLLVPVGARTIGVVHAELPEGFRWPECLNQPFSEEWIASMTWGRSAWLAWKTHPEDDAQEPWIEGLDALVVGHTPVPGPQPWGNMLFLDTGGWRKTGSFVLARTDEILAWIDGTTEPPGAAGVATVV